MMEVVPVSEFLYAVDLDPDERGEIEQARIRAKRMGDYLHIEVRRGRPEPGDVLSEENAWEAPVTFEQLIMKALDLLHQEFDPSPSLARAVDLIEQARDVAQDESESLFRRGFEKGQLHAAHERGHIGVGDLVRDPYSGKVYRLVLHDSEVSQPVRETETHEAVEWWPGGRAFSEGPIRITEEAKAIVEGYGGIGFERKPTRLELAAVHDIIIMRGAVEVLLDTVQQITEALSDVHGPGVITRILRENVDTIRNQFDDLRAQLRGEEGDDD
jgi:hypothetical protein